MNELHNFNWDGLGRFMSWLLLSVPYYAILNTCGAYSISLCDFVIVLGIPSFLIGLNVIVLV